MMGLETSCDETSVAVVKDGREVLSNVIASQVELHAPFGGVVPEIAARRHIECIGHITNEALAQAAIPLTAIDAYAVANGPGLAGALLVGLNYAKGLSFIHQKPLIGVNHIEGHICANYLNSQLSTLNSQLPLSPPFMSLVVSGGHTLLVAVEDYDTYRVVGTTRDDAAGEAFDKVAKMMGLAYPGGTEIDRVAESGCATIPFPRAKVDGFDFSFSGLKTAVLQHIEKVRPDLNIPDIAASFRQAVVSVLTERAVKACEHEGFDTIALAGGVACNTALRSEMQKICAQKNLRLFIPPPVYCTDNAAMIASRGYYRLLAGCTDSLDLNAFPGRMCRR